MQKRKIYYLFDVALTATTTGRLNISTGYSSKSVPMIMQPDSSQHFASLRTPIFTDTLCFQLANCLQGLLECILLDEHGTVCRRLETELSENAQEFTWDGLNDLPYGIYTLQMSQGTHEMNMRIIKRV